MSDDDKKYPYHDGTVMVHRPIPVTLKDPVCACCGEMPCKHGGSTMPMVERNES